MSFAASYTPALSSSSPRESSMIVSANRLITRMFSVSQTSVADAAKM